MLPKRKKQLTFQDLQLYAAIGIKHMRLMILLVILGCLCGMIYYEYVIPVYFASAQVEILEVNPMVDSAEELFLDTGYDQLRFGLGRGKVVGRAMQKLGIEGGIEGFKRREIRKMEFRNPQTMSLGMRRTGQKQPVLVRVRVMPYELARDWVPTLIEAYTEVRDEERLQKHEAKIQSYTRDIAMMGQRSDEFRDKKIRLEEELKLFETQRQWDLVRGVPLELLSVEQQLETIESLKQRLSEPDLSIIAKLSLLTQIEPETGLRVGDVLTIDPSVAPVPGSPPLITGTNSVLRPAGRETGSTTAAAAAGIGNRMVVLPNMLGARPALTWEAIEKNRKKAKDAYQKLLKTYLPGHRIVKDALSELDRFTELLQAELDHGLTQLELMHQHKLATKSELEAKVPLHKEMSRRLVQIKREIAQFDSSSLGWEKSAKKMSEELAKLDFMSSRRETEVRFNGIGELSPYPQTPNRGKMAIFSLAFGVGLALSVVVLIEFLSSTVTVQEQVRDELGLTGLGVIPKFGNKADPRIPLSGESVGRHFSLVETFRVVRTNLLTNKEGDKKRQVIMVTSSIPREGKSMISSNLAATFAGLHEKTLIIDADIRRGKLHRTIGESASPGLSDVLRGEAKLEDALRATGIDNLTALPCGERVQNVPGVLLTKEFEELLAELRTQYTRIIVDTPPVLGLSETCGMLPYVDGVVMVVWCGYTPLNQVRTAVENLEANGANFYGCILNRLDLNDAVNYQHYYYYSNYYYQSYRPDELPEELEAALRESGQKTAGVAKSASDDVIVDVDPVDKA